MTDHVARMVHRWFSRAQEVAPDEAPESELVDAIHRMIREAEDETRRRCEQAALHVAGPDLGGRIAIAIRMNATGESLPRKSLIDAYAERSDH
jgi:hypothetical protein